MRVRGWDAGCDHLGGVAGLREAEAEVRRVEAVSVASVVDEAIGGREEDPRPEIVAICAGPARWMCTLGLGHLCGGEE